MRLPLPDTITSWLSGKSWLSGWSRPAQAAAWQLPLIGLLTLEISMVLMLFWGGGLAMSTATRRWRRWYAQLLMIACLVVLAALAVPVRSADFFITLMVAVLPLTWQLEDDAADERAPLSPAGLTPTIFLVGAVFLYQIQFFVLLLVVAWLLAFLYWYCTSLTGFRLDNLNLRWLPVLLVSGGVAALIVLLFIAVPRVSTGFIPGFASQQRIALTDEVSPGGMRDLLADETIAFRAVPETASSDPIPRYWRVFILDRESSGTWRRGASRRPVSASRFAVQAVEHSYALLLDDHDPATLPAPDWPAGFSTDYGYNLRGELIATPLANPRRIEVGGVSIPPAVVAPPEVAPLSAVNPRLAQWARETRAGMTSDRAFIDLLMRRFATTYRYDTTLNLPDNNALDSFFFEARSGYCAYFATAMATALRAAGIEANITMGYLGGEWNDFGGFWTIRNADAHAWVEARPDGGGWERFDPTLQVMTGGGMSVSGEDSFVVRPELDTGVDKHGNPLLASLSRSGQWIDALNTRITMAIMDYGQNGDGRSSTRDNAALIFLGIGLAMTGVLAIGGIVALRNRRPQHRLERRLERMLADAGEPSQRRPGETMIGFATRRAEILQADAATLARALAEAITELRYSPHARVEAAGIKADLARLRSEIKDGCVPSAAGGSG